MEVRVSWPNGEIERLSSRAKTIVLKHSQVTSWASQFNIVQRTHQ